MAIIKKTDIYNDEPIFKNLLNDLQKLNTEAALLAKTNAKLSASLQSVKKSSDGTEAKELVKITNQLNNSTNKLNLAENEKVKKLAAVKVEQQRLNKINKDSAILANEKISLYQRESTRLTGLRKKYKDLALQNKENTKEGKKLLASLQKLDAKLKKVDNSVGQNQRSVGKYSNALKGLGKQLLSGFGIIAAFGLLTNAFKSAFARGIELNKISKKLKGTFEITTKEANKLAAGINAIALNFDDVSIENLEISLAAVVNSFDDLSEQDALALIEEGFKKGSNNSGEFLDILKEYPVQFKAAGIDAKSMFAIINQQVKSGIYSDKGVDAIKEGGLRLRENTKVVQDALSPFDDYTKQQIRLAIESGKSFEAIQLVSKGLTDTKLTAAETQTIIADVFGGAGEDAGLQYILTLQDIKTNLDDVKTQTSVLGAANLQLSKSYNNFILSVSEGSGIISKSIANVISNFADFIDILTIFNKTTISNKLKIMANAFLDLMDKALLPFLSVLEFLGVEVPKFRFNIDEVETSTKALGKTTKMLSKEEQELIDKIKSANTVTKELTKSQLAQIEAVKKLREENDKIGSVSTVSSISSTGLEPTNGSGTGIDMTQFTIDQKQGEIDIKAEMQADADADELERLQEQEDAKNEIKEAAWNSIVEIGTNIFNSFRDENNAAIQSAADAEISILKNKLDKGEISEKEFLEKKVKIEKKARYDKAKEDRKAALWAVVINTAVGIIKSIANLGLPAAIPAIIATVAIGALQAGVILANPLPKLADGEVNIQGKSHANGGINAEIEGGESVIKKSATANSENLLNMVNDGIITDDIFSKMTNQNIVSDNKLITSLLDKSNSINSKILMSMLNMGYSYDRNGVRNIIKADGSSIEKFNINE